MFLRIVVKTSAMPSGALLLAADTSSCSVRGKTKLIMTAKKAAKKVPMRYRMMTSLMFDSWSSCLRLSAAATRTKTSTGAMPFKAPTKMTPSKASSFPAAGKAIATAIPMTKPMMICLIRLMRFNAFHKLCINKTSYPNSMLQMYNV